MFLGISQLRDQCVIRCAEDRHHQVEQQEQHKQQHIVYSRVHGLRNGEQSDGDQRKRDRDCPHEGDAPSTLVVAAV